MERRAGRVAWEGLGREGRQASIFVPWADIHEVRPTRLYWRTAICPTCGEPVAGTITVWQPVWDVAGPLWQAA